MTALALYGPGMHDHVLRALEVGDRVAAAEDDEQAGWGPLWQARYEADTAAMPPLGDWAADLNGHDTRPVVTVIPKEGPL